MNTGYFVKTVHIIIFLITKVNNFNAAMLQWKFWSKIP